jgi:hypothetical protein
MKWRFTLYHKIQKYIKRDIHPDLTPVFLSWWEKFGEEILNEVEEVVDERDEAARGEALREAYLVISKDANIDSNDINISRALHHIKVLIAETEQEVEYETDPAWENHKRMESDSE